MKHGKLPFPPMRSLPMTPSQVGISMRDPNFGSLVDMSPEGRMVLPRAVEIMSLDGGFLGRDQA